MGRTIVILGANFAGIPIAHYLLKHVVPKHAGLKIILVSPNTHMYWHLAAVRAILPNMLPDEKILLPIAPTFASYPASQFEFVLATATALDTDARRVTVALNGSGAAREIAYDDVVIATGARFREGVPFKQLESTEATKEALRVWQARVAAASSIVIAGAGDTGVEVAGELGQEYAAAGKKKVTLVMDGPLPFAPMYKKEVRQTARRELEKLGVRVVDNSRVTGTSTTKSASGQEQTVVQITTAKGGKKETSSLTADVFLPAYGVVPNTDFVPRKLLDGSGYVKQSSFLQAEGCANVFVVGDAGNLQAPSGLATETQLQHLVKVLEAQLAGRPLPEYKLDSKIMFGVSLGKNKGTGQMGNWKLWSFLVAHLKSRHLGTNYAPEFVAGTRTIQVSKW